MKRAVNKNIFFNEMIKQEVVLYFLYVKIDNEAKVLLYYSKPSFHDRNDVDILVSKLIKNKELVVIDQKMYTSIPFHIDLPHFELFPVEYGPCEYVLNTPTIEEFRSFLNIE